MRYCFCLDLKPDTKLIAEYEAHHKNIWPEIHKSIKSAGIESMEIFRHSNRLFMIMEVNSSFSFDAKKEADEIDPVVQQWENLMWKYQQALPTAAPGEKWMLMDKIFEL